VSVYALVFVQTGCQAVRAYSQYSGTAYLGSHDDGSANTPEAREFKYQTERRSIIILFHELQRVCNHRHGYVGDSSANFCQNLPTGKFHRKEFPCTPSFALADACDKKDGISGP
jgi:hypothetical protein